MLTAAGLGSTIVPGSSTVGGKALWITEGGDAYSITRDRNFYIKLALISSALGVTKYFFYFWGDKVSGALPDMDLANNATEFQAAQTFLSGKTINWVNANRDLTKVAANIGGTVYSFT